MLGPRSLSGHGRLSRGCTQRRSGVGTRARPGASARYPFDRVHHAGRCRWCGPRPCPVCVQCMETGVLAVGVAPLATLSAGTFPAMLPCESVDAIFCCRRKLRL
eukprot:7003466-Prymnesium_polylepis.2